MREIKEVDISMNNRDFTINLSIKDEELIETIFNALSRKIPKYFGLPFVAFNPVSIIAGQQRHYHEGGSAIFLE